MNREEDNGRRYAPTIFSTFISDSLDALLSKCLLSPIGYSKKCIEKFYIIDNKKMECSIRRNEQ